MPDGGGPAYGFPLPIDQRSRCLQRVLPVGKGQRDELLRARKVGSSL